MYSFNNVLFIINSLFVVYLVLLIVVSLELS